MFCCGCFFAAGGTRCAPGARGGAEYNGALAGQPVGACFVLMRVRGTIFLLRVRGKFTHSLAARRLRASTAERNPGSMARFFLCCGCASSLTHSLPAARSKKAPAAKKNAPRTRSKKNATRTRSQKKSAGHTQQKSTHNKKIHTLSEPRHEHVEHGRREGK